MMQAWNRSYLEGQRGRLEVQSYLNYSEFKANLGNVERNCFKIKNKKRVGDVAQE